ncbi:nucleotidyltransferase domain-containing protein [Flexibacterium corallicola]|uniref:nucleotidyltransferase domain-containing protein n=1 Tax=Flexibacterium corallicola TaxID=3037259 RepID=UPI00286EC5A7|nr:nucleotidyltransferase domain-containing protein [Pseudovibrio sp. M1P-2-3]
METIARKTQILRPVGILVSANSEAALSPIGQAPSGPLLNILETYSKLLKKELGQHYYGLVVRGSASRGTFVRGFSDLDLVILSTSRKNEELLTTLDELIDTTFLDLEWIAPNSLQTSPKYKWLRFSIAFSSYGIDADGVLEALPAPTLGGHAIAHFNAVEKWASRWPVYFAEAETEAERQRVCSWIMKRIVRALFEAKMLEHNAYSRDIYPCALQACKDFPHLTSTIWEAAELAVAPVGNFEVISNLTDTLIPFLISLQDNQQ